MLRRWALAGALLAGGCLDAGAPPTGRHWLVDRVHEEVQLVAVPGGGPSRVLLTLTQSQPHSASGTAEELSTVDDPGSGGVAVVRVLADQLGPAGQICPAWSGCRPHVDSLGRLWLDRETFSPSMATPGNDDENDVLLRVDPATGAATSFGPFDGLAVSSDGTRAVFTPPDTVVSFLEVVVDLDGHETPLVGGLATFVGDDLFFISSTGLARLARGSDTPDPLAADVSLFTAYDTKRGWLLLLLRVPALGNATVEPTTSLFDVATATETSLPPTTAMATEPPDLRPQSAAGRRAAHAGRVPHRAAVDRRARRVLSGPLSSAGLGRSTGGSTCPAAPGGGGSSGAACPRPRRAGGPAPRPRGRARATRRRTAAR